MYMVCVHMVHVSAPCLLACRHCARPFVRLASSFQQVSPHHILCCLQIRKHEQIWNEAKYIEPPYICHLAMMGGADTGSIVHAQIPTVALAFHTSHHVCTAETSSNVCKYTASSIVAGSIVWQMSQR